MRAGVVVGEGGGGGWGRRGETRCTKHCSFVSWLGGTNEPELITDTFLKTGISRRFGAAVVNHCHRSRFGCSSLWKGVSASSPLRSPDGKHLLYWGAELLMSRRSVEELLSSPVINTDLQEILPGLQASSERL